MSMPRFRLTGASQPTLRRGQEARVYAAFPPHPEVWALEKLVKRCCEQGYKDAIEEQPPTLLFVWLSILHHLRNLRARGIVEEIDD